MKPVLRRQFFRLGAGLTVIIILAQLLLFAGYEFWKFLELVKAYQQSPSGHAAPTFLTYASEELEELMVLGVIGCLTLPAFVLLIGLFTKRILIPLETLATQVSELDADNEGARIPSYAQQDEIGQLVQTLNNTFEMYQDSVARQARFSSNASHELRTPLTIIQAEAQVALSQPRSREDYENCLGSIIEETQNLMNIIEQLLVLARLQPTAAQKQFTPVQLKDVTEAQLKIYAPLLQARGISIKTNLTDIALLGNASLLSLIPANLLSNAIEALPDGGEIAVTLASQFNIAIWEFQDNGSGIPKGQRKEIFERFARLPNTQYSGAGLGLSIVADAVKLHNGKVEIKDRDTPGTHIQISLPLPKDS